MEIVSLTPSNPHIFFFSSRRRHTRCSRDWSSDVCSSDLVPGISVDPISAYIGDTIIIKGGGFAPGESGIRVYFEGVAVTSSIITANADGYWESSFELPTSTYGSHTVTASGETTQPAVTTSLSTKAELLDPTPPQGAPRHP